MDAISNNVDNYQPNNGVNEDHPNKDAIHKEDTQNTEAKDNDTKAQANDTTIFKKLYSIKDDVDSLAQMKVLVRVKVIKDFKSI